MSSILIAVLLQGFSLDKTYFTKEEQNHIVQALQILKSSNYPDAEKSLNKVAGLFSHNLQRLKKRGYHCV